MENDFCAIILSMWVCVCVCQYAISQNWFQHFNTSIACNAHLLLADNVEDYNKIWLMRFIARLRSPTKSIYKSILIEPVVATGHQITVFIFLTPLLPKKKEKNKMNHLFLAWSQRFFWPLFDKAITFTIRSGYGLNYNHKQ